MSAVSKSVCVYFMHMYQHTQSKYISYILVFNKKNNCLLSFRSFFLKKICVKVLEMYWLLTLKLKTTSCYFRVWCCSGLGQSFLQSSSHKLMIWFGEELEIFLFISWYFTSVLHSLNMKYICTKWLNTIKWYFSPLDKKALEIFRWWLHWASLQPELKFMIYASQLSCALTRNLDFFLGWALWSMNTYKITEFCFLGKYCNSGLKSSSETFRARSNFVPTLQCEKSE